MKLSDLIAFCEQLIKKNGDKGVIFVSLDNAVGITPAVMTVPTLDGEAVMFFGHPTDAIPIDRVTLDFIKDPEVQRQVKRIDVKTIPRRFGAYPVN